MTVAYPTRFHTSAPALRTDLLYQTEAGLSRARRTLEEVGADCPAPLRIGADTGLGGQRRSGMLWVELDSLDDAGRQLLSEVDLGASAGSYSAVVAAPPELIDPVVALISAGEVEVVIGRSEVDRAAAYALALAAAPQGGSVRDSTSDEGAARLRQLSEEVSRIAATLARLSGEESVRPEPAETEAPPVGDLPVVPAETVRTIIRARRERSRFLPADLFADPAWDMLLDLLQAELVQHRVPVSSLCLAAAVPATTALRWIKSTTDRGLLVRRPDPHDGRRIFMEMSRATSFAMRRYFAEVGPAVI